MTHSNKEGNIIQLLIVVLFLIIISSGCQTQKHLSTDNDIHLHYLKTQDKQHIISSFIDIVESYRQKRLYGSLSKYDYEKYSYYCRTYAYQSNCQYKAILCPNPISNQLEVAIDTMIYNDDRCLCYVLMIVKCMYKDYDGFHGKNLKPWYNGIAQIAYRNHVDSLFKIHPVNLFKIEKMDCYVEAKNMLRNFYFRRLKGEVAYSYRDVPIKYESNINDSRFFKKNIIFQRFDSTRYNFEIYNPAQGETTYSKLLDEPKQTI